MKKNMLETMIVGAMLVIGQVLFAQTNGGILSAVKESEMSKQRLTTAERKIDGRLRTFVDTVVSRLRAGVPAQGLATTPKSPGLQLDRAGRMFVSVTSLSDLQAAQKTVKDFGGEISTVEKDRFYAWLPAERIRDVACLRIP